MISVPELATIDRLDLSARSLNALKARGIYSVRDLLNFPLENLYSVKNLGKKSVTEITRCVNAICVITDNFDYQINETSNKYEEAYNTIGKKIITRALERPEEAREIIAALTLFAGDLIIARELRRQFRNYFSLIPKERAMKKIGGYLEASPILNNFLESGLIDREIKICELSGLMNNPRLSIADMQAIVSAAKYLSTDFNKVIANCIDKAYDLLPERQVQIYIKRSQGVTLRQLASDYGVTKERIRQIESTVARKIRVSLLRLRFDALKVVAQENIVISKSLFL